MSNNKVPTMQEIIDDKIHCAIHMPLGDKEAYTAMKQHINYGDLFYELRTLNKEDFCFYFKDGKSSGWDQTEEVIKRDIPIYEFHEVMDFQWFDVRPETDFEIGDYVLDTKYSAYGYITKATFYGDKWHYLISFVTPITDDYGDEIIGDVATAEEIESVEFAKPSKKESDKMNFEYMIVEDARIDKTNNTRIPTITTYVWLSNNCTGSATCDKENHDERTGILNAIANAVCGGNFDKAYEKKLKKKKNADKWLRTCSLCGTTYNTKEEADKCEHQHIENKKARRQRYLERKEARDRIAAAEREGRITKLMEEILKDVQ